MIVIKKDIQNSQIIFTEDVNNKKAIKVQAPTSGVFLIFYQKNDTLI